MTVEYVMMAGVNVGPEDAAALGALFRDVPIRLNPIAVNDATGRFRPPTEEEWNAFRDLLSRELPGQPIVRRYSGGQDEHADAEREQLDAGLCGQPERRGHDHCTGHGQGRRICRGFLRGDGHAGE